MSKTTVNGANRNNEAQEPVYILMDNTTQPQGRDLQVSRYTPNNRLCLWILGLLLIASAIGIRALPMDTRVRGIVAATLIFAVFACLVQLVRLFETQPKTLYPVVFFLGLSVLWGSLASKPPNIESTRRGYVKELMSYNNEPYELGGETHSGIDCSGLARSAMWQAMLKEGVRRFNPYMLGTRLWSFWWRDMTAEDMLKQKYGYTIKIGTAQKLAGYDNSNLKQGDLAIAGNGSYVLIYLGDDKWIEANPDDKKVVVNKATANSKRPYFNSPVTFMRWWILKDK